MNTSISKESNNFQGAQNPLRDISIFKEHMNFQGTHEFS